MKKKIIIFGALGFIGFELTKKLCNLGFIVDLVDIKIDSNLQNELKKNLKNLLIF